jgi:hypothetical protein
LCRTGALRETPGTGRKYGPIAFRLLAGEMMRIRKHETSDIVELEDGSKWRIWPGDAAATLQWLPTSEFMISEIDDEICSHALVDQVAGARVRVIDANADWPAAEVQRSLKRG